MLADQLDYVVGVDPHRDAHAIGIVSVRTGAVVFEAAVRADTAGYEEALRLAEQLCAGPARVRGRRNRFLRRGSYPLPRRAWRAGVRGRPTPP